MAPAYPSSCFSSVATPSGGSFRLQEKAEQLLEDLRDGLPFAALAQGAEEPVLMGENLNPPQIARKEAQSGASSQLIGGDGFNVINQGSGMTVGCVVSAMFVHLLG